jgi:hypothetical protein
MVASRSSTVTSWPLLPGALRSGQYVRYSSLGKCLRLVASRIHANRQPWLTSRENPRLTMEFMSVGAIVGP